MRVAILADIHGNLPACEAVLQDIARSGADVVVAAGDLALRGAHPRETVELLFDRCEAVLMGNTDCYIAGNYLGGAYREREHWKRDLLAWTRDQLGPDWTRRLGELPFSVRYSPRRGQDLYVCHANPRNLEESVDPTLDEASLRRFFAHLDASACAFGHLHFPYRRRFGRMLLADVASAGIPRDGDVRPAYGVFTWTPRGWRVQIRRVRYSVRRATQALTARRVPGGPLLVHKLLEAKYRHHAALIEAARRHSGLPPAGGRPAIEALRHQDEPVRAPVTPVLLTPPEGIPAQVEHPGEVAMAAVGPLGDGRVDGVDESDSVGDETAVTFR
ncbi:MAG TPA: metallophosphoesterase family protein [Myxococcaceae bacterium]|nr:metallophosphoesterase family protein [Myxococcaceae bacterium]